MGTSIAALGLILVLVFLYVPVRYYISFRKNLAAARATGIPCICVPIFPQGIVWSALYQPIFLPILQLLPNAFAEPWRTFENPNLNWRENRQLFEHAGSHTIFLVSSDELMLLTADPDVIMQITTRRNDFPKPMEIYKGLAIYGENVVTVEGGDWKRHRKATMPQFGESNNRVVWKESLFQAGEMLKHWTKRIATEEKLEEGGRGSKSWGHVLHGASSDCMRLSLYVISRAGFNVRCRWPGEDASVPDEEGVMRATEVPAGRSMSYMESMETLLHNLLPVFAFPPRVLAYAPFAALRLASKAYFEWGMYMNDVFVRKQEDIVNSKGTEYEGMDLMGALIKYSGHIPGTDNFEKSEITLTKEEIIGNSFIMFLAGHETAANSIHFALLFLAARPTFQTKLQADLDEILGDKDPSEWSYDSELPKLFAGLLGAVLNEELRVIAPVVFIPKCTMPGKPQTLHIEGEDVVIPGGTVVGINTPRTHRHPKYWPYISSDPNDLDDSAGDLETFKPERWLADKPGPHTSFDTSATNSHVDFTKSLASVTDDTVDSSSDTAASFFRPAKGAYIPFSIGPRACLGRRFAQIEVLAVLAVILKTYSVELSTDAYADPRNVDQMSVDEKRKVWEQARTEMERKIRDEAGTVVTLQLRGDNVDLKLRKRGQEVFRGWDEGDVYVSGAKLR
jgi:cytochrome P450